MQLQIDYLKRDLDAQNKERQKIYEDMVLGKINTSEYSNLKSVLHDLKFELTKKGQQLEQMEIKIKYSNNSVIWKPENLILKM